MMTAAQRARVHQFFAGYFHEDWAVDADTPDQVLSEFIREKSASGARELLDLSDDIKRYVAEHPHDDELDQALFKELGCYYSPRADGGSARAWLLEVAAKLEAAAQGEA